MLPVRSGARSTVSSTADSLFLVQSKLALQVPEARPGALPAAAAGAAGEGPAAFDRRTLTFDLAADPGALTVYWGKMQHAVAHHATSRGVSTTKRPLGRCFPFDRAPEVGAARLTGAPRAPAGACTRCGCPSGSARRLSLLRLLAVQVGAGRGGFPRVPAPHSCLRSPPPPSPPAPQPPSCHRSNCGLIGLVNLFDRLID